MPLERPSNSIRGSALARSIVVAVLGMALLPMPLASAGTVSPIGDDEAPFCLLHQEPFESFSAPQDVSEPGFSIDWCETGGSVASSGFCPTGQTFRIEPHGRIGARFSSVVGCGRLRIGFVASSLFDTWSRIEIGPAMDGCDGPIVQFFDIDVSMGECRQFEIECSLDESDFGAEIAIRWIHGGGDGILQIDEITFEGMHCCGDPPHPCCLHPPC